MKDSQDHSDPRVQSILADAVSADSYDREQALARAEADASLFGLARVIARALSVDVDLSVRMAAVEALGRLGHPEDECAVSVALRDQDWSIRASAVSSLAGIGGIRAEANIVGATTDADPVVRRYAWVALVDLVGAKAEGLLRQAAAVEESKLAAVGIYSALAQIGDPVAIERLPEFAADPDPHINSPAISALAELAVV